MSRALSTRSYRLWRKTEQKVQSIIKLEIVRQFSTLSMTISPSQYPMPLDMMTIQILKARQFGVWPRSTNARRTELLFLAPITIWWTQEHSTTLWMLSIYNLDRLIKTKHFKAHYTRCLHLWEQAHLRMPERATVLTCTATAHMIAVVQLSTVMEALLNSLSMRWSTAEKEVRPWKNSTGKFKQA